MSFSLRNKDMVKVWSKIYKYLELEFIFSVKVSWISIERERERERKRKQSVFTRTPFEEESCSRKPLCEHSNLSIVEIARYRSRSNNSNYKTISIEFSNKLRIRSGKSFSPVSADCTVNQTSETTQLSFNRSVKFAGETTRATKIQAPIFFFLLFLPFLFFFSRVTS